MKYSVTCKPSDTELHCWVTEDDWNSEKQSKLKCTHTCTSVHMHTQKQHAMYKHIEILYIVHSRTHLSCHAKKPLAPNSMFTALQLLHPLTDKQGSPPTQHHCWSHPLHTHQAQLWIWNGTFKGCMFAFPFQHSGSWGLLWLFRLKTISDFLYKQRHITRGHIQLCRILHSNTLVHSHLQYFLWACISSNGIFRLALLKCNLYYMHIYAWSDGDIPFMHVFTPARTHTHTHTNVSRLTCVQQDGSETGHSQKKNETNQSSTECNHSWEEVSTVWTRPCCVEFETKVTATNMVTDYHTTTLPWQQEGIYSYQLCVVSSH